LKFIDAVIYKIFLNVLLAQPVRRT